MYESATHYRLQSLPEAECSVKIPSAPFSKPTRRWDYPLLNNMAVLLICLL
jgi:hypothetical protein